MYVFVSVSVFSVCCVRDELRVRDNGILVSRVVSERVWVFVWFLCVKGETVV